MYDSAAQRGRLAPLQGDRRERYGGRMRVSSSFPFAATVVALATLVACSSDNDTAALSGSSGSDGATSAGGSSAGGSSPGGSSPGGSSPGGSSPGGSSPGGSSSVGGSPTNPQDGPPAGYSDGHAAVPPAGQAEDVSSPTTVIGTGTPASCTGDAFVSAVAKGGIITFNCGP